MRKIKLGVIGMSEGNGHPYSWSAIFNGYDTAFMKECPFPVIPDYLGKQKFPEDGLGHLAAVTTVWCQEKSMGEHIAAAAKINHVASKMEDMIGNIDALLLARDDADNHYEMALPFLKAGIPVFIDKPLAVKKSEAEKIMAAQVFPNQVFSCTALRYAQELLLTEAEKKEVGKIVMVEGSVMKKWETYGIHVLEPLVAQLPHRGKLVDVKHVSAAGRKQVLIEWENVTGYIKTTGDVMAPLELKFMGDTGTVVKKFGDTFNAFKNALAAFIEVVHNPAKNIAQHETLEMVTILEKAQS